MPPSEGSLVWPQEYLRNICILAHVDHGKTSCADCFISSNGIISNQSAGKLRYMDTRLDEQERMITMKSSAIALQWREPKPAQEGTNPTYLVNVIDSPGHVDFSSEVSSAVRLADGAIVVIDVVEGVSPQTRTVLRQAWRDRVKTCLLLNKMDRLILEMNFTPMEAYLHIQKVLEQANVINMQFVSEDIMARDTNASDDIGGVKDEIDLTAALDFDDAAEEAWRYAPEKGNVAFGSALHGWAFRVETFAQLVATKMGANPKVLREVLWGDWCYHVKSKKVCRRNVKDEKQKPMFVQFVLEQLWKVYDVAHQNLNVKHLKKMQAQIPSWGDIDMDKVQAGSSAIKDLMSRWLPFADAVLKMVTVRLPNPSESAASRLPVLCPRWFAAGAQACNEEVAQSLRTSSTDGAVVVYVAKFLAADLVRLTLTGDQLVGDEDVAFVGFCRVFAGTLVPGQKLFVMAENDTKRSQQRVLIVDKMFRFMGRLLEEVVEASSGGVVAAFLRSPEDVEGSAARAELGVERCLTLCDAPDGPFLETPYSSQAFAIVRVSIQPQHVKNLDALHKGLRLLHKADPSVSIEAMVTGENVLGCSGDEHLRRCITDLHELYARGISLRISQPLVGVRESIARSVAIERIDPKASVLSFPAWASHLVDTYTSTEASSVVSGHDDMIEEVAPRMGMSNSGIASVWTGNRRCCLSVSAVALSLDTLDWMDEQVEELESVVHREQVASAFISTGNSCLEMCLQEISRQFDERTKDETWGCPGSRVILSGLSVLRGGRALLLSIADVGRPIWMAGHADLQEDNECNNVEGSDRLQRIPSLYWSSVISGFQAAANAGPLCEEPIRGVAFVLHGCRVVSEEEAAESHIVTPLGELCHPMSGQVMIAMKECCRLCFFRRGYARICEAMLSLEVQCEELVLGKVYGVLGQRRAKIRDEGLLDGTSMFFIHAFLPLADSFGLAHDLRTAASGYVLFHCAFSHWELSEDDPFQEASLTAEEVEDLGEQPVLVVNNARKLLDAIRKRKGLAIDEKIVSVATKQRTVTRMK